MLNFVFSDIHGQGEHFRKMMAFLDEQTEKYRCVFLGDACDRGPDGYDIMKQLLANPHMTYLKGNHEDMFVKACWAFVEIAEEAGYSPKEYAKMINWDIREVAYDCDISLSIHNGGTPTLNSWLQDSCPLSIVRKIENLPVQASCIVWEDETPVKIFDLCHAGCYSSEWETAEEETLLWDRTHFSADWDITENEVPHVLVHGHTPVEYLSRYTHTASWSECQKAKPILYMDGHKLDMDTGVFYTGITWMVELSTMTFTRFKELNSEKGE